MGNSALGRGTAVEENKVKASSGATPGFLDGIVDDDTMKIIADQLQSVNEFRVGNFTRDMAAATAVSEPDAKIPPKQAARGATARNLRRLGSAR